MILQYDLDKYRKYSSPVSQKVKQGDTLKLKFNIYENGISKNLTGYSADLRWINADNTFVNIGSTKVTVGENLVTVECDNNCTKAHGTCKFELHLHSSLEEDYSFTQKVDVYESVYQGQAASQNVSTILDDLNEANINAEQFVRDYGNLYGIKDEVDELNNTKADRTELDTVNARIDNFTHLAEGSTTGDAELTDGRIGINGEKYSNLGEAIRTQISNISSDGLCINRTIDFSSCSNGYINPTGQIIPNTAYHKEITLNKYETVRFYGKGYLENVSLISKVVNGNYAPILISSDSNPRWYEYTANEKCTIVLSFTDKENTHGYILYRAKELAINSIEKKNIEKYMLDLQDYVAPFTDDCYINYKGEKKIGTVSSHVTSDVISLKKGDVVFTTCSALKDIVSVISKVENDKYTPLIISSESEECNYRYEALEDVNIVISATKDWDKKYTVYNKFNSNQLTQQYDITPSFSMFEKFAVIGDSYASGEVCLTGYNDFYNVSWGQILARMTGTQCLNLSKGGLSTQSWLTSPKGLTLLNSSDVQQLYILALGINDYYGLGESYLGTKNDITTKVDTFYGNYAKIIEAVKTKAPKAKIIMFTIAGDSAIAEKFNKAIIDLANHYEIPYLIQNNDEFFKSSYYRNNMLQGHPVAAVYSGMAKAFKRMIEKCMFDNFKYFKDYIGEI